MTVNKYSTVQIFLYSYIAEKDINSKGFHSFTWDYHNPNWLDLNAKARNQQCQSMSIDLEPSTYNDGNSSNIFCALYAIQF